MHLNRRPLRSYKLCILGDAKQKKARTHTFSSTTYENIWSILFCGFFEIYLRRVQCLHSLTTCNFLATIQCNELYWLFVVIRPHFINYNIKFVLLVPGAILTKPATAQWCWTWKRTQKITHLTEGYVGFGLFSSCKRSRPSRYILTEF